MYLRNCLCLASYILASILLLSLPLRAQNDPDAITWIPKVSTPPVIDGEIDPIWHAHGALEIARVITGEVENPEDLSAVWYGLYDDTYFYFLIDIHDQILESEAGSDIWRNDRIEVYFNMDNVKPGGTGHSGDNYQYAFHWNKPDEQFVSNSTWTGVEWAYTTTDYGYITEVKIPFTTLTTLNAVQGFSFGFDIAINDNDGNPSYDSVTYWWNSILQAEWGNIDGAGTVGLGDDFDGNFGPKLASLETQEALEGTVSQIGLAATDEDASDTLTFTATDLPAFASLVDNGDRTATITIDGQAGDANVYSFAVTVSDGSKEDSDDLILILRDPSVAFQVPVIESIADAAVGQGELLTIAVSATDLDSLTLVLSGDNLPTFAGLMDHGDKTATLTLNPDFSITPGTYTISVQAEDPDTMVGTASFKLTIEPRTKLTEYYCDPATGDMANEGGPDDPWSTLQAVFEAGKAFTAGDVIFLRSGYHGEPAIGNANDGLVTIRPDAKAEPTLSRLEFTETARHWLAVDLQISRSYAPEFSKATMVSISGQNITVSGCSVFTVPDIAQWTLADWLGKPSNGITAGGMHNRIENCTVLNTAFAIQISGSFNTAHGNRVHNFSGDGLRGLGDDLLFEYNTVTDNYNIDDNHDDGFQSWSTGENGVGSGVVYRMTLRGNVIIETTDPNRPFQGPLQGIGCFDGMFEDWVVENNVVVVNQWHGLTLLGAKNCRIVNNTVVDQNFHSDPGPTWIAIEPHKKYATAETIAEKAFYLGGGNMVLNNLTTRLRFAANLGTAIYNTELTVGDMSRTFIAYPYNLRLRAGSSAIDNGSGSAVAPDVDADRNSRPMDGNGDGEATTDQGAYEFGHPFEDRVDLVQESDNRFVRFTLDKSALGVRSWYGIQISSDLKTWSPDPVEPIDGTTFEIVEEDFRHLVVQDTEPVTSAEPRFLKLVRTDP